MGREKVLSRFCRACEEYNNLFSEYKEHLMKTGDYSRWTGLGTIINMACDEGGSLSPELLKTISEGCEQKGCKLPGIYTHQKYWTKARREWHEENEKVERMENDEIEGHLRDYFRSLTIQIKKQK